MNNNDLMNALSGLDPKYIDEAAYELHDEKADAVSSPAKKATISRMRRTVFITLPAVAAILLTFTVGLSVVMRLGKSGSASMATSDSAAYEQDYAEEAAADAAADYEAEAEASPDHNEAAEDAAPVYEAEGSAAEDYDSSAEEAAEALPEEAAKDQAAGWDSGTKPSIGLENAVFSSGILTIDITGTLPENAEEMEYKITASDDSGNEKTYDEGTLGDILKEKDPLTLDISDLDLPEGTYTLSLGEESVEFKV